MAGQFPDYPSPPVQKSSNTWLWIVLGVIGVVTVLGCGCCGGFGYFSMSLGAGVIAQKYSDHPTVQDKLGGVTSASMNFGDAIKEAQAHGGGGGSVIVLDVKGPKGAGQIIIIGPADSPESVTLKLKQGGESFPLVGDHGHDHGDHDHGEVMEKPAEAAPSDTPAPPAP